MGNGTQIGRVRGLGAAGHGSEHWINQRVSALANILLTVWLLASFFLLPNSDYETVAGWLAQPLVAVPMILMIASIFWHARLGLQVFIEDYVPNEGSRLFTIMVLNFYVVGAAAFGIFIVAKHAFTGAPA